MIHLTIDNKKYVLISKNSYQELQRKATLKSRPERTLSIDNARAYSKNSIGKWSFRKS